MRHVRWSTKALIGTILLGFWSYNTVEGIVNHHVLGLHHVNETVAADQWLYWDLAFLIWGIAMIAGGAILLRAGNAELAAAEGRHDRRRYPEAPLAGGRRRTDPHSPQAV
jgi:uncharacterized membrane protein